MFKTDLCSTDNRPVPKPHFAAVQQPPQVQKAAVLPAPVAVVPRPSMISGRRQSLVPSLAGPSRAPRVSSFGIAGPAAPYPTSHQRMETSVGSVHNNRTSLQLTDKEIDERVSHASNMNPDKVYRTDVHLNCCRYQRPWKQKWPDEWRNARRSG